MCHHVGRTLPPRGYLTILRLPRYNGHVGKWKPARARKKAVTTGSKGRLIGCLVLLVGGLFLFFLLFSAILKL